MKRASRRMSIRFIEVASTIMIRSLVIYVAFLVSSTYESVVTARGRPVSSSSISYDLGPEMAVDGNTSSEFPNIFHTALNRISSWWWVDLGENVISPEVTIFFRTDGTGRRNGVRISLSPVPGDASDFCKIVSGAADGSDIPAIYEFTCDGYGRYLNISTVTIIDQEGAVLDFGEVEVYACSLYTFGPSCDSECHCAGDSCNWRNPVCSSGCTAGWKSAACDRVVSAAEVSIYTKHTEICDVPVSYHLEAVALTSILELEQLDLESRIECLHKCEALVLCVSFEYTSPTCTLWRSGSSGLSGSRDMWTK